MLYFPKYPGAEEKIYSIFEKWHKEHEEYDDLNLKIIQFPGGIFDFTDPKDEYCLVDCDWDFSSEEDYEWLEHPEIFAIGYHDGSVFNNDSPDDIAIYHPKWGIKTVSGESEFSIEPWFPIEPWDLDKKALALLLLEGESAFELAKDFSFMEIANIQNSENLIAEVNRIISFIVLNYRDLELREPRTQIELLRNICFFEEIIKNNSSEIPLSVWRQFDAVLGLMPQILASLANICLQNRGKFSPLLHDSVVELVASNFCELLSRYREHAPRHALI